MGVRAVLHLHRRNGHHHVLLRFRLHQTNVQKPAAPDARGTVLSRSEVTAVQSQAHSVVSFISVQKEMKRENKKAIAKLEVRTLRTGDPVLCLTAESERYVTMEHKSSHKGQFFEIEIYASSES